MDNKDNNNVVSMRDYLENKHDDDNILKILKGPFSMDNREENLTISEQRERDGTGVKVIQDYIKMLSKLDEHNKIKTKEDMEGLSMSSIQEAIHYEYRAQHEVMVTFESKEELFKILKRIGLAELLRVKYCNLENPVIKEFFEHIKKED